MLKKRAISSSRKGISHFKTYGFLIVVLLAINIPSALFISAKKTSLAQSIFTQVPHLPLDYRVTVEDWWSVHPYNPQTTAGNYIHIGAIQSPDPAVNVCDYKNGSDTAGIEQALAALPATGGTLFFPGTCSPYLMTKPLNWSYNQYPSNFSWVNGGVNLSIIRRSNLHFISDTGATIRGSMQITSMGWRDRGIYSAVKNFYFKNITFDYPDNKRLALIFEDVEDVLFDNVTFLNSGFLTVINNNNYFIRDSRIVGGPGIYFDGSQGSGILNTSFEDGVGSTGIYSYKTVIDFHVNMDGTRDNNKNGVLDPEEQRIPRYVLFDGNSFSPGVDTTQTVFIGGVRDAIFKNNNVTGTYGPFVHVVGDVRSIPGSNPSAWFDYYNYTLSHNTLVNSTYLLKMLQANQNYKMGVYSITYDMGTGMQGVAQTSGTIDGPIVIENNCINGKVDGTGAACSGVPTETPSATPLPTPTETPLPSPTPEHDTTAPTVMITNPQNNDTVSRGQSITITANASDNIGVVKVEFLVNNAHKCTDSASPYACAWSVPGKKKVSYSLVAKAYDDAGNTATSQVQVISK